MRAGKEKPIVAATDKRDEALYLTND